jgi:hypothetical protein
MDYYLSFPDEAAAIKVLYGAEDMPNFANIDTIGVIYKPTGKTIEQDGITVPVMAPIKGWHVNVRLVDGEDDKALQPFAVTPSTPTRVWG